MKKFFTLCLMATALMSSAKVYTMADLATLVPVMEDGSGVAVVNGEYVITLPASLPEGYSGISFDNNNIVLSTKYFTIKEGNGLKVNPNEVVRFAGKTCVEIEGTLEADGATFAAAEGAESTALGFRLYKEGSDVKLKDCTFEYVGITYGNGTETGNFQAEGCTFNKHNGKSANSAISFTSKSTGNLIVDCIFNDNELASIASGANVPCGILVSNCKFYKPRASTRLYPPINISATGSYDITIDGNEVHGPAQTTRAGGIALSCLLGNPPTGQLTISNNFVEDCSYGITLTGPGNVRIINNTVLNNKYIANAAQGGSGINITCSSNTVKANAYLEGNHIEGNLWGITAVALSGATPLNSVVINAGKTEDLTAEDYNPGNNVFINNGNDSEGTYKKFDYYNNTANDSYAQGNTWSVDVQDDEHIAEVVVDKADNPALGTIIYLPAKDLSSISDIKAANGKANGRFNILGQPVDNSYRGIVIENGKKLIVK